MTIQVSSPAKGSEREVFTTPSSTVSPTTAYERYHIDVQPATDITVWPSRFKVDVKKIGLAKLLIKELIEYRGNLDVVMSRPCLYGVFSGPVGGFAPREQYCVGCLRCTTQYPEFVQIRPNPEREQLGDSYFHFNHVNAISYEASNGRIPVKGQGYRGKFGGEGWDGMWTDMSEIVRPTRDGIHGREFISTVVDIGSKPAHLVFDGRGDVQGEMPATFTIPLPIVFDMPPAQANTSTVRRIYAKTALDLGTLNILPVAAILQDKLNGEHLVPLVTAETAEQLANLPFTPKMVEMDGWDAELYKMLRAKLPASSVIALRVPFANTSIFKVAYDAGVRVFHLTANYHGRSADGRFVLDLIRRAHGAFVDAGIRSEVTLLGSGGMIVAEHIPKSILCGLDVVVLDTALLMAMQARFHGEFVDGQSVCTLPEELNVTWGNQRLKNLMATWRDQLLEIMGAMGLREVRRMRGEMGRAMFQKDLEKAAFAGIEGYEG